MGATADREQQLRRQLSDLHALFVLGMVMTESRDAAEILRLAVSAVPSLGSDAATALLRDGRPAPMVPAGAFAEDDLACQVESLGNAEGPVRAAAYAWARAFPLHGVGVLRGHLVVAAAAPPSSDAEFLWRVLAHQARQR